MGIKDTPTETQGKYWMCRPNLPPVLGRESVEREDVGARVVEHPGDFRVGAFEHPGDLIELGLDVLRVGLGEDGADDTGDDVLTGARHDRENVSHEVDSAALPGGALEDGADRLLQTGVGVGDDELDTVQTAGLERAEEARPEGFVFAVASGESKNLAAPVGGNPDGDDHGLGDDAVVDTGLAVSGVEEDVGVAGFTEVPAAEPAHFAVEIRANPGDFRLGDAGVRAKSLDQIVDLAGRDAVEVSLHNDGEQGLVDTAAPLEEGGKERPLPQLRDLQIQVPSRRRDPGPGSVALGRAVIGAFKTVGADVRGGLGVDEFLVERFGHHSDSIGDIGQLEFAEEGKQGRLV